MFCWRSSDGLADMSKTDILRGIITEKLSTAAREILAVVERTVADYEEEASGFRQQIETQRRQLEVLQPHVRLSRVQIPDQQSHEVVPVPDQDNHEVVPVPDQDNHEVVPVPDLQSHEVVVFSEDEEEITAQKGVEDVCSASFSLNDDEDEGTHQLIQQAGLSQLGEDRKDPDYQVPSRSKSSRVRSGSRKSWRSLIPKTQNLLEVRVRFLEDSEMDVVSEDEVRSPVQVLTCPRGLRESDFLELLRSTFPQLAAGGPLDFFIFDNKRRTMRVKTVEEARRTLRNNRDQVLYIRLKDPRSSEDLRPPETPDDEVGFRSARMPLDRTETGEEEMEEEEEELHLSPTTASPDPAMMKADAPARSKSSRVRSGSRKSWRSLIPKTQNLLEVRVRFLEDSEMDVVSEDEVRSPVQVLTCPRGLRESDFLELLRSTFPQLAAGGPSDFFIFDNKRRTMRVKTVEEARRTLRNNRDQVLYIRLKDPRSSEDLRPPETPDDEVGFRSARMPLDRTETGEEEMEEEEEELHLSPTTASPDPAMMKADAPASVVQCVDDLRVDAQPSSSTSQQQDLEMDENPADNSENAADGVEDGENTDKDVDYCDDQDGDSDWGEDSEPDTQKRTKKQKSEGGGTSIKSCTVCGVWYRRLGGLKRHAWTHTDEQLGDCGICGKKFESVDELKRHLKNHHKIHVCSDCGKSFTTVSGLNKHKPVHTGEGLFTCNVCSRSFAHHSNLKSHSWVHMEEKPHKCDICGRSFGMEMQLKYHRKLHVKKDEYLCNLCGKTLSDRRALAFHKLTHTGERRHTCDLCGKSFKLLHSLKSHMETHTVREQSFLCHICCKSFFSNTTLMSHIKTHSDERPFNCTVCGKGFKTKGDMTKHMRIHTGEKPHCCPQCGRFFRQKCALDCHLRSHADIRPYVCGVCGKACLRPAHLKVHMRIHNGEKPYQCTVCDKAFTQSHCLKTHMKSHQAGGKPVSEPSMSQTNTDSERTDERQ